MTTLSYPFSEKAVRALKAGDVVSVNGKIWTGRDRFHKHFNDGGNLPVNFRDGALYHCGPVVVPIADDPHGDAWRVVAGGPTTSARENPYEPLFIERTGVRLIIGKGGMNANVRAACEHCGAVYLQAVGGAAAVTAQAIKRVTNVYFLKEFGAAEACWEFLVEDFRCVVGIDSHGVSLFEQIQRESAAQFEQLIRG